MIYVIQSAGYDSKGQFIDLINIQYVLNAESFDKEFKENNPTARILFKVGCEDPRVVGSIEERFKEYRFSDNPNKAGWFVYNEEIIKFFKDKI